VTSRSPDDPLDGLATKLAAHLSVAGSLPRMEALAWLESQGLGFHEAIDAVNHGIRAGVLAREGGEIGAARVTAPRKKNRILVVDDEPAVRQQLAEVLRDAGYEIVEAVDGYQAMDCLREPPLPALVLLDLILPGPSGWDVLAWMRRVPELAAVPVRILTGMGDEVRVDGAMVLAKPLDLDKLMSAVSAHCSV
jgi:CheY-like chemotaxis protein